MLSLLVYGNLLTGASPSIPSNLQEYYIGYPGYLTNKLTGSITMQRPILFYINGNLITDVVLTDRSALTECDLSDTPLLGNSNVALYTECDQYRLYDPLATFLSTTASKSELETTAMLEATQDSTDLPFTTLFVPLVTTSLPQDATTIRLEIAQETSFIVYKTTSTSLPTSVDSYSISNDLKTSEIDNLSSIPNLVTPISYSSKVSASTAKYTTSDSLVVRKTRFNSPTLLAQLTQTTEITKPAPKTQITSTTIQLVTAIPSENTYLEPLSQIHLNITVTSVIRLCITFIFLTRMLEYLWRRKSPRKAQQSITFGSNYESQ